MKKIRFHITAQAKDETRVDLYYNSIGEAKYHNPGLKDFRLG